MASNKVDSEPNRPEAVWSSGDPDSVAATDRTSILPGDFRSTTHMYNQTNYSGHQSEPIFTSHNGIPKPSQGKEQATGTTTMTLPTAGLSQSRGQMFNQTSYGLQSDAAAAFEMDEKRPKLEPSLPTLRCAEYETISRLEEGSSGILRHGIPLTGASQGHSNHYSKPRDVKSSIHATSTEDSSTPISSTTTPSKGQSHVQPEYLHFIPAAATSSGQDPSNVTSSSLPSLPTVDGLPADPAPQLHRRFRPYAVHTAICDYCNKRNSTVIQRCQDCNMQFCEYCIKDNKVGGNHEARYEDLEWNNVGPSIQPINTSQGRRRQTAKKGKTSAVKRGHNSAASSLTKASSAKITQTRASRKTTRAMTRATTRAATAISLRKSAERRVQNDEGNEMFEDDGSMCAGSITEEDPMDEEEVREKFREYYKYPAGSLYGRPQTQNTGYVQDSSRLDVDVPVFGSGLDSSISGMGPPRLHRGHASSSDGHAVPRMIGMHYNTSHENHTIRNLPIKTASLIWHSGYRPASHLKVDLGPSTSSIFRPLLNPYEQNSGHSSRSDLHLPPSYEFGLNSGASPRYGFHTTTSYDSGVPYSTYEGRLSEKSKNLSGNRAELQQVQDQTKIETSEKPSYQAHLNAFQFEMQAAWENHQDTQERIAKGMMKDALEQFEAVVILMSMNRCIYQDDAADMFLRVTGEKMTG